ncbi:MAG: hypothetical protein VX669_01790 [Planctomycetota bacterium]|nr:hypothetical protein [Planctomycetota bacterium]
MPADNTPTTCPSKHALTQLITVACFLLIGAGCRDGGDGNYREITKADIVANNGEAPATAPAVPSDVVPKSTGTTNTGDPQPVDTKPGNDTPTTEPTDGSAAPVEPAAGPDPVNPLRPALPAGGFDQPPGRSNRRPGTANPQDTKAVEPVAPRKIKLLVKERTFQAEGPNKALRVSYDDFDLLKVLNMEPVPPNAPEQMPGWLKQLDGKRIRVRGFMYPTFQDPVDAFVLARDNQICCFGRNPKIYDLVRVALRKGVTSPYIQNRPFDVVGLFHIAKKIEDGRLLYSIDDAIVVDR